MSRHHASPGLAGFTPPRGRDPGGGGDGSWAQTGAQPGTHDTGTHDGGTGSQPAADDGGTGSQPAAHDGGTGSQPAADDGGTGLRRAGAGASERIGVPDPRGADWPESTCTAVREKISPGAACAPCGSWARGAPRNRGMIHPGPGIPRLTWGVARRDADWRAG